MEKAMILEGDELVEKSNDQEHNLANTSQHEKQLEEKLQKQSRVEQNLQVQIGSLECNFNSRLTSMRNPLRQEFAAENARLAAVCSQQDAILRQYADEKNAADNCIINQYSAEKAAMEEQLSYLQNQVEVSKHAIEEREAVIAQKNKALEEKEHDIQALHLELEMARSAESQTAERQAEDQRREQTFRDMGKAYHATLQAERETARSRIQDLENHLRKQNEEIEFRQSLLKQACRFDPEQKGLEETIKEREEKIEQQEREIGALTTDQATPVHPDDQLLEELDKSENTIEDLDSKLRDTQDPCKAHEESKLHHKCLGSLLSVANGNAHWAAVHQNTSNPTTNELQKDLDHAYQELNQSRAANEGLQKRVASLEKKVADLENQPKEVTEEDPFADQRISPMTNPNGGSISTQLHDSQVRVLKMEGEIKRLKSQLKKKGPNDIIPLETDDDEKTKELRELKREKSDWNDEEVKLRSKNQALANDISLLSQNLAAAQRELHVAKANAAKGPAGQLGRKTNPFHIPPNWKPGQGFKP
ncbi:uncharacterized protein BDV17DRAFT_287771 [Aspergillus undulatus]|uniref:uncharacterized protein n=1 Tax=Aspergillus undulatus TaxID=1810928 RepID=UPI003CCD3CC0